MAKYKIVYIVTAHGSSLLLTILTHDCCSKHTSYNLKLKVELFILVNILISWAVVGGGGRYFPPFLFLLLRQRDNNEHSEGF